MLKIDYIRKYVPRSIILILDIGIAIVSIIASFYFRFNFQVPENYKERLIFIIPLVASVRLFTYLVSKIYAGIIRYTSTKDALRIFWVNAIGSAILLVINFIHYKFTGLFLIPNSILAIDYFLVSTGLTVFRFAVKGLYFGSINWRKLFKNVLIYGGDEYGLNTKRAIEREPETGFKVVAFIDDDSKGNKLDRLDIFGIDQLEEKIKDLDIKYIVLAKKHRNPKEEQKIIDIALENNVKILRIPKVKDWIDGQLQFKQIKKINIEDLLEREPIKLDTTQISTTINGETVLVTGGAGSIGSEIVRQLTRFNPKKIIILDQAETPLYDIELEMKEKIGFENFDVVIGDISDKTRMKHLFETFKPTIVYHAAAYKHVPMMEKNPYEAVKTNVMGTRIMADLAVEFSVKKFVMISTDKAVRPTNIMGASKRIAEIYTQSLNKLTQTQFITTRFGNVLGSNGSVILRFRKQIEEGGPVTVTHPEITRYFMTIPEACQLVLEASAFGKGGEIFIFDMGDSVKIVDLAKKMIQLSGLKVDEDIKIQFTGLRPGEKLYEELLNDKENTIPTHHPKIMIAVVEQYEFSEVKNKIDKLISLLPGHDNFEIVRMMKIIVPEFKSKNSVYEKLDKELEGVEDQEE